MKKLLLLVQFVFLTVSISYGQFVSCEIKSVCENDLLQSEELIAFFQKSTNSNAQDSWHTLYLANEVGKRIDNIALTNVSNNLKQTSKSVDDLADEITEVGGYVKWKVLANTGTKWLDDLSLVKKSELEDYFKTIADDVLVKLTSNTPLARVSCS